MTIIREPTKLRRTIAAKSLREQELSEHYTQADAQNDAEVKGWRHESLEKQEPLSERDTLVTRIEQKINQPLPNKFRSGPLPAKAKLFCVVCSYDRNESLEVVIERDLSAYWHCHYSSCDLDGQIGKRHGKPVVGPEVILARDDDYQRRFGRHYLYADLPDVLRKRMLFEEDAEFDAGPDEPIRFLKNFISFMPYDKAARKYWNRALDRYAQDLFAEAKAMLRGKLKGSGRPWPPKYITNDKTIMSRVSTCKMIEEVYPCLREQRWAVHDCLEWCGKNLGWRSHNEHDDTIAPILVTLNAEKTAKALSMSPDELELYSKVVFG